MNSSRAWASIPRSVVALLVPGVLLVLGSLVLGHHSVTILHSYDFSPQADETRPELSWTMIRPTIDLRDDVDPLVAQGMPFLRTSVAGETIHAGVKLDSACRPT